LHRTVFNWPAWLSDTEPSSRAHARSCPEAWDSKSWYGIMMSPSPGLSSCCAASRDPPHAIIESSSTRPPRLLACFSLRLPVDPSPDTGIRLLLASFPLPPPDPLPNPLHSILSLYPDTTSNTVFLMIPLSWLALFLAGLFRSSNQVLHYEWPQPLANICPCREEHMVAGAIVVGAIKIYIRPYLLVIDTRNLLLCP